MFNFKISLYAVLVVDKYGVGMQGLALCKFRELLPMFLTAFVFAMQQNAEPECVVLGYKL